MMTYKIGAFAMAVTLMFSSPTEATPQDEAALKTMVESVATFADTHRFDALEKLYADEVLIDYSSLSGAPAALKSPQGLMTEWAGVLPGFDRTRHDLGDIHVDVQAQRATATADVSAGHWLAQDYWQVDGTYAYEFAKDGGDWKITSMTLTVESEVGSRDIFGPAIAAAQENPADYLIRQQTRQTVLDFLTALEEKDMEKVNNVWADDAVQDMPYVPEGFPSRVVGKEALIAQYAAWPEMTGDANFTDQLVFYPMVDPQTVFVEFRGVTEVLATERTYRQQYGGLFHVERGKITLYREYFDPRAFAEAFGMGL